MFSLYSICGFFQDLLNSLVNLWESTGVNALFNGTADYKNLIMIVISFILFYLAVVKKFEPLLLLPIAFGMFIVNIPGSYAILFGEKGYILTDTLTNTEVARGTKEELLALFNSATVNGSAVLVNSIEEIDNLLKTATVVLPNNYVCTVSAVSVSSQTIIGNYGLFYYIYKGVDWVIFPPLIFLGIGAMTDFGPLIANPKSMFLGAAAQIGIFITFVGAVLLGFDNAAAGAIAIIGGADGPTAIYVTKKLAEDLLPAVAIAAYSYMALIPLIQKPIMRLLTTKNERKIKMKQLRRVSKAEKVIFPILVTLVVGLLLPDAMPLLGMLMLGNLLKESGVADRLVDTAKNGLMNTVTIFLGVMVGSKAVGETFLAIQTLEIIALGLIAFSIGTASGLLVAKLMNVLSKGQINPLIGSAGVSAVPMAARISQDVGREEDPNNHLLMHAMGPNVAGVIGSAIAAGVLLALFG